MGEGDDTSEPDPQVTFLEALVEEHATIAGDVMAIGSHTWAIHGYIAVDGDVIMAEYDTEEHARIVLGALSARRTEPTAADEHPPMLLVGRRGAVMSDVRPGRSRYSRSLPLADTSVIRSEISVGIGGTGSRASWPGPDQTRLTCNSGSISG